MSLKVALEKQKFIVTCELAPPKGTDVSSLVESAKGLKNKIDAVNLTDGQAARMRMCPLAAGVFLLKENVDVIWQLTCRDRNRIGIQADCLGASSLGIQNVLPMYGDPPEKGDHPDAKGVYDIKDTTELIKVLNNLNNGIDLVGNKLNGKTNFLIGCTAVPNNPDLKKQKEKLDERFSIGAHFIQTNICYEIDQIKKFLESLGELAKKTIIGITPLKDMKMVEFFNKGALGNIAIPKQFVERLEKYSQAEDQRQEGLNISREIVDQIRKTNAGGIHVMAIRQEDKLPNIIDFLTKS